MLAGMRPGAAGHAAAHLFTRSVTLLSCWVLAAFAGAQPHPATGIYEMSRGEARFVIELHVDHRDNATGVWRRRPSAPGTYFEGTFQEGRATGVYEDESTILSVSFMLELHHDVLAWYTYAGSPGSPPVPAPEPTYYLRQPGPGPAAPLPAPHGVLLRRGRNEAVIAVGAAGAELQLRDARNFLELAELAFREAGHVGPLFPGRIYLIWLGYATSAFHEASPEVQAVLAASEAWWPHLEAAWAGAAPHARQRVVEDVLLMVFGAETVEAWILEGEDSVASEAGGPCGSLMACVLRVFDQQALARARSREPCFSLEACPPQWGRGD